MVESSHKHYIKQVEDTNFTRNKSRNTNSFGALPSLLMSSKSSSDCWFFSWACGI